MYRVYDGNGRHSMPVVWERMACRFVTKCIEWGVVRNRILCRLVLIVNDVNEVDKGPI